MSQSSNVQNRRRPRPALRSAYKTRKNDRRRDEVLDAAAEIFAAKGFHNATLKDIALHVGVVPASLYHYIDSKEAALIEVCRRSGRAFNRTMQNSLADTRGVPAILRDAIGRHMQNNRRELVFSFVFRSAGFPGKVDPEFTIMAADYQAMWESLIVRGVKNGELKTGTDPHVVTVALLAMLNGSIEWYRNMNKGEIDAAAKKFADFALAGICTE